MKKMIKTSFKTAAMTATALIAMPALAHDGDHSHSALAELFAHAMGDIHHFAALLPLFVLIVGGVALYRRKKANLQQDAE